MGNEMTNYIVTNKNILKGIIASLKRIDVRGYESMDRLVGCVIVLESLLKPAGPKASEPPKSGTEDKEKQDG